MSRCIGIVRASRRALWALLSMRYSLMTLTKFLILRKPRSGCLEERTALIQPIVHFFPSAFAG
jgi:hypothetical protein